MNTNEILNYLKNSTTNYDFWPDDVKKWAKKHDDDDIWAHWHCGAWIPTCEAESSFITRLRSDYQPPKPEPEYVDYEVKLKHSLYCVRDIPIADAETMPNFAGWVDKDGVTVWYSLAEFTEYKREEIKETRNGDTCIIGYRLPDYTKLKARFWAESEAR